MKLFVLWRYKLTKMNQMKVYFLVLSFFFSAGIAFAQNTVTGKVTDPNGLPLPGATIAVVDNDASAVSDENGNFTLKTSKKPPFQITVTMVGFTSQTVNVVGNTVTVRLAEEETLLNEVVVSASRTPERILESPVTVERMSSADIKATTASTFYDGLENLKEVHFNTSSLSFKSINTRGFATVANTRFLQLVDGMDNSSPALNFVLGNLIGVSDIDVASVELLPGASSALYGANAFNGIMFMNSKNPFNSPGLSAYYKRGETMQDAAGINPFFDFGIRAAYVFTDWFAAKANVAYTEATEWIANDRRDMTRNVSGFDFNPNYDGLNLYGDEVSTNIQDVGRGLAAAGLISPAAVNILPSYNVARTGYEERDLNDSDIKSLKADFSLHFRPFKNDFEIILQHKLGTGNTVYQGANRYALRNFEMNQTKIEVKANNFFWRAYMTTEDAGDSYDMRFAAWNVNRAWKADNVWFGQYAGAYIQSTLAGATPAQAHATARTTADSGRFVPGSAEFNEALARVTADPDLRTGAKFQDQSKLYHSDLNYNFKDLVKFGELMVGGSWRRYEMNSNGTIFTDFDGPITYDEYGAYTQFSKKLLKEERLKFTGSIRYDKSQNFDGFVSPRVALVYSAGATKKHNFRLSYQTGFRNPTTQDQYIGLDLGPFALIGSAPDNLSRYTEVRQVSAAGQAIGQPATVTLDGNDAYFNSYTLASVAEFGATGNPAVLQVADVDIVKPERVTAFELGYRTVVGDDFAIDINGYYNIYNDFLNQARVFAPLYGDVNDTSPTSEAVQAIANGDRRLFQVYTNSKSEVTSLGFGIGASKKVYKDYEVGVNYNHAQFEFNQAEDPSFIPGFNTPKHRLKGSFGNPKAFKNFGFNMNVRWNSEYLWQSSFADGMVPDNTVFDAQINYAIPSLKAVLKVGGTNLFGDDYIQVIGAGEIGKQWYASVTINP